MRPDRPRKAMSYLIWPRYATLVNRHVFFAVPLGSPTQSTHRTAGRQARAGRANSGSHAIESYARGNRIPRGVAPRLRRSRPVALRSAAGGIARGARGRCRLLPSARPRRRARPHPAHGEHQRGLLVPVQAAGGPRRSGAGAAAFLSALRVPGQDGIARGAPVPARIPRRMGDRHRCACPRHHRAHPRRSAGEPQQPDRQLRQARRIGSADADCGRARYRADLR